MKIAHFWSNSHLPPINLNSFVSGMLGMSGTDSSNVHLAYFLSKQNTIQYFLFTSSSIQGLNHIKVVSVLEAIKIAKTNQCDYILFNHRGEKDAINAIKHLEKTKIKGIIWCQNFISKQFATQAFTCKYVARIVCVSNEQANCFRHYRVFDKISVIYNGVDTAYYQKSSQDSQKIVYLGSLTESKGFQHLAQRWGELLHKYPNIELHVIGSGKLYDIHNKLGTLGIAESSYENRFIYKQLGRTIKDLERNRVFFHGTISPIQIRQILFNAKIGVVNLNLKGSFETFCVSAIELSASGIPVIGANKIGLKETVKNNVTGLLINRYSDINKHIETLLQNPEYTLRLGSEGIKYVTHNFSRQSVNQRWLKFFLSLKMEEIIYKPTFIFSTKNLIKLMISKLKI